MLSPDNDLVKLGNFLGDFVRPSQYSQFPKEVVQGIELHKKIDELTDSNLYFKNAVEVLRPETGKYASVVFDIVMDHVIIKKMPEFNLTDLRKVSNHFFSVVDDNKNLIPESAQRFLGYAKREDVFYGYANIEKVRTVLYHMDHRTKYPSNMERGVEVYLKNKEQLTENMWNCFTHVKENLVKDGWL